MSAERDLDLLRETYAAWARGDFTREDVFDPEVEFGADAWVGMTHTTGPPGMRESWYEFLGAWKDFRVEARRFVKGAAKGTYVVFVHLRGQGKESGIPIEADGVNVVEVRHGRIKRLELLWDEEAALRAAGLRG